MERSTGDGEPPERGDSGTGPLRADGAGPSLFEATPHPVLEYTSDSDDVTIRRANPAFEDVFDPAGSLVGESLSAVPILDSSGNDGQASTIIEHARAGERQTVRLDGEPVGVDVSYWVRVVPTNGGDGRGYIVFSDAHARGETPSQLEMVDFLTHSIRNPLEVAKVNTEVSRETGELDYLDEVTLAHERIERIAEETLDLVRQGRVVGEMEPTDVGEVAREAWRTVRTEDATLDVGTPGTVQADRGRLRELLENLFRNAIVHGSNDETASVTVVIEATADGFYVADDGVGIPDSDREQVLDMGYTTADEGTGLGLAIVADIAESHGWELDIGESESGGARFDFLGVEKAGE